ncbi:MAG: YhcH/YjgK/YiaL family protein [Phycisphaerae bacterium]|jgi:YhcH/YjgK/YiaL family protein
MILDRIENADLYVGLNISLTAEHAETAEKNYIIKSACSAVSAVNSVVNASFAKAFEILKDKSLATKQDGKYPVDGENIYYTIQRYTTKPMDEGRLEAHRKYIDIQFLLEGEELLGYMPLEGLKVSQEYDCQKDIAFYQTPAEMTQIKLEPGLFCILFPQDAHLPGCSFNQAAEVKKIVIKIKTNG